MKSFYQTLKQIPSQLFLFIIFITIYWLGINILTVKLTPIFYLTQIAIAIYFKKNNKFKIIYIFIFITGVLDDIIYSKILGITSIFNIIYFGVIDKLISKYGKNLAKYIILSCGLIFYSIYEICSLLYLRINNYTALLFDSDVILMQLIALGSVFTIQSIMYLKKDGRIFDRRTRIMTNI